MRTTATTRRAAVVTAATALTLVLSGCTDPAEGAPSPTPLPTPNGTTEYHRLSSVSTDPIASERAAIDLPASEGFDAGRTVISVRPDSKWEWYDEPSADNEHLYSRQMGAVYRGFGLCTSTVAVVRDSGDPANRWAFSDEMYGRTAVDFFNAALGVKKPARFHEKDVVGLPYHEEGLGQMPFFTYSIPGDSNNAYVDMKVFQGLDYNTGYMVFLTLACQVPSDTTEVYELMTDPGNEYSVYIDVLPKGASPAS